MDIVKEVSKIKQKVNKGRLLTKKDMRILTKTVHAARDTGANDVLLNIKQILLTNMKGLERKKKQDKIKKLGLKIIST